MEDSEDGKTEKLNPCDEEIKIMDDGVRLQRVAEVLSEKQFENVEVCEKSASSPEEVTFYCGEKSPDEEEKCMYDF